MRPTGGRSWRSDRISHLCNSCTPRRRCCVCLSSAEGLAKARPGPSRVFATRLVDLALDSPCDVAVSPRSNSASGCAWASHSRPALFVRSTDLRFDSEIRHGACTSLLAPQASAFVKAGWTRASAAICRCSTLQFGSSDDFTPRLRVKLKCTVGTVRDEPASTAVLGRDCVSTSRRELGSCSRCMRAQATRLAPLLAALLLVNLVTAGQYVPQKRQAAPAATTCYSTATTSTAVVGQPLINGASTSTSRPCGPRCVSSDDCDTH